MIKALVFNGWLHNYLSLVVSFTAKEGFKGKKSCNSSTVVVFCGMETKSFLMKFIAEKTPVLCARFKVCTTDKPRTFANFDCMAKSRFFCILFAYKGRKYF